MNDDDFLKHHSDSAPGTVELQWASVIPIPT